MRNYLCKKCKTLVQVNNSPNTNNCPSGGSHQWTDLGQVGTVNYQCSQCSTTVKSASSPNTNNCPAGSSHRWTRL